MRLRSRRPVTIVLFIIILLLLSTTTFVINQVSRGRVSSDSDSTGTLARASNTEPADALAAQTAEVQSTALAETPGNDGSPATPKPNETGVPTPFPTVGQPQVTPAPTSAPDVWKNCPAFAGRPEYPTPAPGESATCPTPAPQSELSTPQANDPFVIRACAAPDPPDDPDVTKRETASSSTVVIGTVQQVLPPRWTTADGRRPAHPHAQKNVEMMAHIVTPVQFEVQEYLKGQLQQSRLLLWSFGGTIANDVTDACGSTQFTFQPGQQVIVFLKKRGPAPGQAPVFDVVTRYAIGSDGQAVVNDRSLPVQQLLDHIRAAVKP